MKGRAGAAKMLEKEQQGKEINLDRKVEEPSREEFIGNVSFEVGQGSQAATRGKLLRLGRGRGCRGRGG